MSHSMKILNTGTHHSKKTFITFQHDTSITHFPQWRTWQQSSTSLCKFCQNSQTLQHVVSGCKVYLHKGRYNWRHDSILKNLVTYFKSIRGNLKYYVDIPGFEPPSVITGEERRPDIVIRDTNKLYIIELTVGFETRILINAERKLKHYENLCKELSQGFESVIYVNPSMGALGSIYWKR